jgi:hypothetical protein
MGQEVGMIPQFDMSSESPDGAVSLRCPSCAGVYTHQGDVRVVMREEDAEHGLSVSVSRRQTVVVGTDVQGNPSPRRHGLSIEFLCETCHSVFGMDIYQHKGVTRMVVKRNGHASPETV